MAILPTKAQVQDANVTNAQQKTYFGNWLDFCLALLGNDSATPLNARIGLGVNGLPRMSGVVGQPNVTTPLTQYDLAAASAIVSNSAGDLLRIDTLSGTVNISTAGPAANGRDQAGALGSNVWVYVWQIYNSTTLTKALLVSLSATNPTLPSGYTHKAYATALRLNGSGNIVACYVRGSSVSYATQQIALTGGTAIAETTINFAPYVPPGSPRYRINAVYANGATVQSGFLKLAAGVTFTATDVKASATIPRDIEIPNVGQSLIYVQSAATLDLGVGVTGYYVSNGDS